MRALTKNLRRRAAILIAVAYAFCVLAPSATLAVVDIPTVFHCISELSAKSAPAEHVHADGVTHRHDQGGHDHGTHDHGAAPDHQSDDSGKGHAGTCCGLFCVSAIAHDPGLTLGVTTPASSAVATVANHLAGRAPGPLQRPPIA